LAKKPQTQVGGKAVRAKFLDAVNQIDEEKLPPDPDPNLPRNGVKAGQWPGYPSANMPGRELGCLVRVVGRDSEGIVYVVTTTGHLRRIEKWDHAALVDIFAPMSNTLKFCWPAYGKAIEIEDQETGEVRKIVPVKRAERDPVIECLINEAARLPDFDPHTQHRGRGGWQDGQGAFVWHSGGWLWQADRGKLLRSRPAPHEGYLYARQAATIEPWQTPVTQEESPARRILEDLRTWNWQRPYLDPILVLGWIATALMGGGAGLPADRVRQRRRRRRQKPPAGARAVGARRRGDQLGQHHGRRHLPAREAGRTALHGRRARIEGRLDQGRERHRARPRRLFRRRHFARRRRP
jgi:hypothetical protein